MADPPAGPQTCRRRDDRTHQLVGVKAALHQDFRLGLAHKLDGFCGGRARLLDVFDLVAINFQLGFARDLSDAFARSDQDRFDQILLCRFDGAD